MEQLGEINIVNPHNFSAGGGWFLNFTTHSRMNMGSSGWWLVAQSGPFSQLDRFRRGVEVGHSSGRTHPSELDNLKETLEKHGYAMPAQWVRFMGAWWDKEYYDKRMAQLVNRYKATKVTA